MIHDILMNLDMFKAVDDGFKKSVILDNTKRGVQKGDLLRLQEAKQKWRNEQQYAYRTGFEILAGVTYVDTAKQREGFAVISINIIQSKCDKEQ